MKNQISPQELLSEMKRVISYDQISGIFTWEKNHGRGIKGEMAGSLGDIGYVSIGLLGKSYLAHRLAWFFVHGSWPKDQIDHINGIRSDNRIFNLRESTQLENTQNTAIRGGASKYPGVHKCKRSGKWIATINFDRKRYRLGRFSDEHEAGMAYVEAKKRLHTFQPFTRGFDVEAMKNEDAQ